MGNSTGNDNSLSSKPHHASTGSTSISLNAFSRLKSIGDDNQKESKNIYKEILKDIKKLRVKDGNKQYNPHRREQSILISLPQNLKKYSNTIHVVNEFWLNNMKCLSEAEFNEIAMLLYCHLYCQCKPQQRKLLLKATKMNVPSHTLKIFVIFEYVVRQIIDSHNKVFKQLRILGLLHTKYLNNSDDIFMAHAHDNSDIYMLILNSFNYAMEQTFNILYSVRVRFCFTQLYQVIIDIMNNSDLRSLIMSPINHPSTNDCNVSDIQQNTLFKQVDAFLGSLEDCLHDEIGSLYFKKYLEEQFCAENYLFHEAVQKYRSVKNSKRITIGANIINMFIKKNSEKQINISSSTRNKILTIIHLANRMNNNKEKYQTMLSLSSNSSQTAIKVLEITKNNINIEDMVYSLGFTINLFDGAYDEIFYLMNTNSWLPFRNTILGYCGDDNFIKQQQLKHTQQKNEKNEKRQLINSVHNLKLKQDENDKRRKRKENERKISKKVKIVIKTPNVIQNEYLAAMNNNDNDVMDYGDSDIELEFDEKEQHLKLPKYADIMNNDQKTVTPGINLLNSKTSSLKLIPDISNSSNVSITGSSNVITPNTPALSLPSSPPLLSNSQTSLQMENTYDIVSKKSKIKAI